MITNNLLHKISIFDNQCLRWISHTRWHDFVRNVNVQNMVFGGRSQEVGDVVKVVMRGSLEG